MSEFFKYCKVRNCRYPSTHTTLGHTCGKCKKIGHGRLECDNDFLVNELELFDDKLPLEFQCTYINCSKKEYHKNDAHICDVCFTATDILNGQLKTKKNYSCHKSVDIR